LPSLLLWLHETRLARICKDYSKMQGAWDLTGNALIDRLLAAGDA
jgi:hypothetical protein